MNPPPLSAFELIVIVWFRNCINKGCLFTHDFKYSLCQLARRPNLCSHFMANNVIPLYICAVLSEYGRARLQNKN